MRLLMAVQQPCVLCQGTLEQWLVYRDDETDEERIDKEVVGHHCYAMDALVAERRTPVLPKP
jgi:hypothetical protein